MISKIYNYIYRSYNKIIGASRRLLLSSHSQGKIGLNTALKHAAEEALAGASSTIGLDINIDLVYEPPQSREFPSAATGVA